MDGQMDGPWNLELPQRGKLASHQQPCFGSLGSKEETFAVESCFRVKAYFLQPRPLSAQPR